MNGPRQSMAEKSPRRLMLEQSLAEDPNDPFLRYGLAMQCLRDGDVEEGRQRLRSLIADDPDRPGRRLSATGPVVRGDRRARKPLGHPAAGVAKAQSAGDWHAAAEMEQLIDSLDGMDSGT